MRPVQSAPPAADLKDASLASTRGHRGELLVWSVVVAIYWIWFGWPSVLGTSEGARMASVFIADEGTQVIAAQQAIHRSLPVLNWGGYGHLYFNITLIPLWMVHGWIPVTDQMVLIAQRLTSLAGALAVSILSFSIARRYFGSFVAWMSGALLAVIPFDWITFSVMAHPDTLQVAFVMASLSFCCHFTQNRNRQWLYWASVMAGLAFSTKFGGCFILPIIWLLLMVEAATNPLPKDYKPSRDTQILRLSLLVMSGLMLAISFVVTTGQVIHIQTAENTRKFHQLILALRFSGLLGMALSVWPLPWKKSQIQERLIWFMRGMIISGGLFWLMFVVTSPCALLSFQFVHGMISESAHVAFGHVFKDLNPPWQWFVLLASTDLLGPACAILACLSLAGFLWSLFRHKREGLVQALISPEAVLWFWSLFILAYFLARVRFRAPRYMEVILPALLILACHGLVRFHGFLRERFFKDRQRLLDGLCVVAVLLFMATQIPQGIQRQRGLMVQKATQVQSSISVKTGIWLEAHFPPTVRVLYDMFSYVPPVFTNAQFSFGTSLADYEKFHPDVVVVNDEIRERYAHPEMAPLFRQGPEDYLQRVEFYRRLESGALSFVLVKDNGNVRVYARPELAAKVR